MKDPTRLIDVQTGRGLQLLRAARAVPAPPVEAFEQALATLGANGSIAVASVPALTIAKWIALGVALGAGGSAIAFVASGPEPTHETVPAESSRSLPAAITPGSPVPSVPVSSPSARFTGPPKVSPRPAPFALAASTLSEEIAALDRVRNALSHHEAAAAMVSLDDYVARFPAGQLTPEAALLRVRALVAVGKGDEARVLAEKLVTQSQDLDYAARVREAAPGATR